MSGSSKDPLSGLQRTGGNCAFSSEDLTRAGAGVSGVFVATSLKVAVLPARLRRCEPPPSPTVFVKGECLFGRLAQLFFRRAVTSRLTPSPPAACALSGGLGDPGRSRGAAQPRVSKVGTRGDGGGSHRLAVPGREQLCSHNRDPMETATPTRSS